MTAAYSRRLLAGLLLLFLFSPSAAQSALPKKGTVALVLHEGSASLDGSGQTLGTAEATVLEILLQNGYSVVNPRRMEEIRRSKAARAALDGDVDAILRLGSQYGVGFFVSGRAKLPQPRQNEFGLFTATADIAVEAYSTATGKYVFSGTASGKQLGYSAGEALEKALTEAARAMAASLVGAPPQESAALSTSATVRLTLNKVTSFNQINEVLETCRHLAGVTSAKATGYSGGAGQIELDYRGDIQELGSSLAKRQNNLAVRVVGPGQITAEFQ
ncbi:hypothetical protein KAR29_05175 [Aminithiophilus ramosus]|uniref:Uncharacterized protein n=2 Tax=Synergistales TaxID=649776 RepID=A0A9Q7EX23_9BACT|nr:hypothetical protein [Aminithiophilus ramosus]QTX33279.1 hypothetical protein KAR29_05175 [Aminithiophilus ramosus]QVL36973.1 hypothetical protein KIH16_04180 [Synergistota bacterium]